MKTPDPMQDWQQQGPAKFFTEPATQTLSTLFRSPMSPKETCHERRT